MAFGVGEALADGTGDGDAAGVALVVADGDGDEMGAVVVAPDGRASENPGTLAPFATPGESPLYVYSGAWLYANCSAPLSLRVKEEKGAGSVPAGAGTSGHAVKHPPVQFEVSGVSFANS